MKDEFTTQDLLKLTGVPRRTLNRYVSEKWVVPIRQGGGRGKANIFDKYGAMWTTALNETFQVWPRASARVLLWQFPRLSSDKRYHECRLSDGSTILDYLRAFAPTERLIVTLALGYNSPLLEEPTDKRFALLRIVPLERADSDIGNFLHRPIPFQFDKSEEAGTTAVVRSVCAINLYRIQRQIDSFASRLR